ncbi:MAG: hypothetical protein GX601_15580 [Anaerolineales bacterium]|nr:hypothetical protein [Anaerolineales bacterium]
MLRKWLPLAVATLVGVVVLLGYLFPDGSLGAWAGQLVDWAIILAAFALVLGLLNILRVHGARIVRTRRGWFNSLVLVVALFSAAVPALLGPSSPYNQWTVQYILAPLGAAVAALMVFTLVLAAFRMLRVRRSLWTLLFLAVVIVALLGSVPLVGLQPVADLRSWLVAVPGMAGMRGLLLGVALGIVVLALRLLGASERPHTES